MDSWAFEQLNRLLTPDQSPQNGPGSEAERNASSLSFPVSGSELQAQLEAWTSATFDFDSILPSPFKESSPSGSSQEGSAAPIGPSFGIDNYALGIPQDNSSFGVDPLLHPGPYGSDLYTATQPHNIIPGPPVVLPHTTGVGTATPAAVTPAVRGNGGKAAGNATKKRRQSNTTNSPASDIVAVAPASVEAAAAEEERLNQVAIEEDKRRRNTAASARFRVKKKQREAALESTAKELRDRVNALEKEVEALRTENGWLRGLIVGKEEADRKAREDEGDQVKTEAILA